ncbi:MAG: 3-hydroxyacyl-ACP dehydratase FabZ [Coriobacteriaceae bacterium]|nr:3-hydroxyacyl-ACP dehydratase FabZ [Coriobacteriaceae bacterium]
MSIENAAGSPQAPEAPEAPAVLEAPQAPEPPEPPEAPAAPEAPGAFAGIGYPCTRAEIRKVLPHRDPFLWLDRIVSCTPGKTVVAELEVAADLAVFAGHFPAHPVFPGVLVMEALAQAASFCILVERGGHGTLGFLAAIDEARFRNQVRPQDVLRLEAAITKSSSRMCVAQVSAWVGDTLCASATQKYVIAPAANTATSTNIPAASYAPAKGPGHGAGED